MLSHQKVARFLLLPELKLTAWKKDKTASSWVQAKKVSAFEVCPKCATKSITIYDHRIVKLKDAPIRGNGIRLTVKKRRFFPSLAVNLLPSLFKALERATEPRSATVKQFYGPVRTSPISNASVKLIAVQAGSFIKLFMNK